MGFYEGGWAASKGWSVFPRLVLRASVTSGRIAHPRQTTYQPDNLALI